MRHSWTNQSIIHLIKHSFNRYTSGFHSFTLIIRDWCSTPLLRMTVTACLLTTVNPSDLMLVVRWRDAEASKQPVPKAPLERYNRCLRSLQENFHYNTFKFSMLRTLEIKQVFLLQFLGSSKMAGGVWPNTDKALVSVLVRVRIFRCFDDNAHCKEVEKEEHVELGEQKQRRQMQDIRCHHQSRCVYLKRALGLLPKGPCMLYLHKGLPDGWHWAWKLCVSILHS